jgi:BMFP domain-containing protein YqiC
MTDDAVKLDLILNQQGTLLTAMNVFREDLNVMMEILRRLDHHMAALADRICVLEERP